MREIENGEPRREPDHGNAEIANLRVHTARGTLINSAFMAGLAGLSLFRRFAVAAFLTREEFGIWGILLATLITLAWLKQIGISDKYIQQSEPDQELAFQKAFTLELGLSALYFAVCCLALPAFAVAYGHGEIIVPGMVLATAVVLTAFQTPAWVPYRRMQYARQRTLLAVDPVVSTVVTLALCAAGHGYWGIVIGAVAGSFSGAVVCVVTSPYKLRLRFQRDTLRDYASFSWPLVGFGLTRLLIVQGSLLVANRAVGLAGIGAIGLASSVAAFADRVDGIVSQTIYPAVCAVADKRERLIEVFEKSNRVALMWAMPFATAVALFANDLVEFAIGDEWRPAVGLVAAVALTCGIGQIAFNWTVFMRALDHTRPLFWASLVEVGIFLAVSVPAILLFGLTGYAIGFAVSTAVQIAVRAHFMRVVVGGTRVLRQIVRSIAPIVPAAAIVLALRALPLGDRTLARALGELALFVAASVVCTYLFERKLVTELLGYVRGRVQPAGAPSAAAGA
jgi:O-antigen/teichoic acid export membrane protein